MNFFGHATIASRHDDATPAFVLGAMLPDFASISGARSARAADDETARGVALHHATDELFHGSPDFVALTILTRERCEAAGLARGSARAAAHVGVELLLDGLLTDDARAASLYVDALADHAGRLACGSPEDERRLTAFLDRARGYGVPYAYSSPDFVAARVVGALSSRPRLAIATEGAHGLAVALSEVAAEVRARKDGLLGTVLEGLWNLRGDRLARAGDHG